MDLIKALANERKRAIWKICVRYPRSEKEFAPEAIARGFVAIGWNTKKDLQDLDDRDEVKELLLKLWPEEYIDESGKLGSDSGVLWRFVKEISIGDWVLMPNSKDGLIYVGKITSDYYQLKKIAKYECDFFNRRNVKWLGKITGDDIIQIWGKRHVGQPNSCSLVAFAPGKMGQRSLPKRRMTSRKPFNVNNRPDREWGILAEKRAMVWLKSQGLNPKDVSLECKGWDIECDETKYEVKGRHFSSGTIKLTENEYNMAKKYESDYLLMIFTARTEEELVKAQPVIIPDPANSCNWRAKQTWEYFMEED